MKPAPKKKIQFAADSGETLTTSVKNQTTGIISEVGKDLWKNFFLNTSKSVIQEPFGFNTRGGDGGHKMGGDMQPGQEVILKKQQAQQEKKMEHKARHQEVYFDEIRKPERFAQQEHSMIVQKIDEILGELKKLANSTTEMQSAHKEMAAESAPAKAGTYHINFYEFLLGVLRSARQKMEESSSWQAMFKSKKKQRQYGNMAKKHGTSFTLSSERTTATQTG